MPVKEFIARTRRERTTNAGNVGVAVGPQRTGPLVDYDGEFSSDLVLTVWVDSLTVPDSVDGDVRPYVRVEWGNGGTDASGEFEVTKLQRIPVAGSKVRAVGYLKGVPQAQSNGTAVTIDPVPLTCQANFRAFIADHTDALPLVPTYWIRQMGVGLGNLIGPADLTPAAIQVGQQARMVTLHGFVCLNSDETEVAQTYLQLFDQDTVPAAGDLPVDVIPLIATGPTLTNQPTIDEVPPDRYRYTMAFARGVAWAVSTTPFSLSPLAIAQAFVEAEFEH